MTATDGEKEQRLRDIARRIREIIAERAVLEEKWKGQPPLDASLTMAALSDELGELRRERDALQVADFTPAMAKNAVDRIWDIVSTLEAQVGRVNKRLDRMDDRHDALDARLTTWFERDASERAQGRALAMVYRLVLLAVVAADLVLRVRGMW